MNEITKKMRIVPQRKTRTLSMASAILILNYYADVAPGQRALLNHFKGTEHKIHRPKLRALINGDGFKDWEIYPEFINARARARAKADRQNRNGPRPRTPDALDDVVTFKRNSPSSVYSAKVRIDEEWCKFNPDQREQVSMAAARDAGGGPVQ